MTGKLGRIVRFGLVGVLNTGVYYGLYLLFKLVLPYMAAHIAAFVLAMVGSYFMNCFFTFRTKPSWRSFLLFPLSNATNFAVTTAGLYVLVTWFAVNQRIAPLLAAAVAVPFTFIIAQLVLTGRSKPVAPPIREEERTS
ncbi:GtrA family protein [Saccharothrix mutabilis subsp. mutabilis]|uniref:GtrA family protein n=1 Tax=Saccharothrix mutabilis subsp. mutabilis TaxID=66855 RepID=A0ABN0T374_9PSEU